MEIIKIGGNTNLLIKIGNNEFDEIKYKVSKKNYCIMDSSNSFCDSNEVNDSSFESYTDYFIRLSNLLEVEDKDWGNKEVYLSFNEVIRLINFSKYLYDTLSCRCDFSDQEETSFMEVSDYCYDEFS